MEFEHASRIEKRRSPSDPSSVAAALNLSEQLFVEFCLAPGNDYTSFETGRPKSPKMTGNFFATDYRCGPRFGYYFRGLYMTSNR